MRFLKSLFLLIVFIGISTPNISYGDNNYCIHKTRSSGTASRSGSSSSTNGTVRRYSGGSGSRSSSYTSSGTARSGATSSTGTSTTVCAPDTTEQEPTGFITCYEQGNTCNMCSGYEYYWDETNKECKPCPPKGNNEGFEFTSKSLDNPYGIESCRIAKTENGCKLILRYNNSNGTNDYTTEDQVEAEKNHYINDEGTCTACPDEYRFSDGGVISKDDCYACTAGGYITNDDVCMLCQPGYYCKTNDDGEAQQESPTLCPINTYSYEGATECSNCADGYTTYNNDKTLCKGSDGTGCFDSAACKLRESVFVWTVNKTQKTWQWPDDVIPNAPDNSKIQKKAN